MQVVARQVGVAVVQIHLRDDGAVVYVNGEEAFRLGFATRVCTDPLSEALATAAEIASKNPHAQRANKRLFDLAATTGDEGAILRLESKEQGALIGSPNQVEAVMSNMQKREPKYTEA